MVWGESDSKLQILIRSLKQISFVQIERGFLRGDGADWVIYLRALVRFSSWVFELRKFKPTSTTDMSGAAPSAFRSALDSIIRTRAAWRSSFSFSLSVKDTTSKCSCGGAGDIIIHEPDRKQIEHEEGLRRGILVFGR